MKNGYDEQLFYLLLRFRYSVCLKKDARFILYLPCKNSAQDPDIIIKALNTFHVLISFKLIGDSNLIEVI